MLGEIVGLAARVTSCDACLVYLAEADTGEFVLRASLLPHVSDLGNLRVKMGEGVTGWVAEHQSPVALSSKAASDPRSKIFPTLVEDTYQAFLSVPLVTKGKAIGVITFIIAISTSMSPKRSRPFPSSASRWAARSPRACWKRRMRASLKKPLK